MLIHPKNSKRKIRIGTIFLAALFLGGILYFYQNNAKEDLDITTPDPTGTIKPDTFSEEKQEVAQSKIPQTLNLSVPFTPQAPTANWDELHNDACEEASIIMAWAYFNNITSLPPELVEREIDKLTKWQQDNYGYYLSITTPETARMAREVYGLNTEIVAMTEQNIKQALAADKLVILPAQGQLLGNPNFRAPGPPYHMLVITGWTRSQFITNDPGTRRGENYRYTFDTLYQATGNYYHETKTVNTNEKEMIVVSK